MIGSKLEDDWQVIYDRTLEELAFGIEACLGQFKLMVVRCNSDRLRTRAIARLNQLVSLDVRQLQLPESTTSLFGSIRSAIGNSPPQALNIWGFESVVEIDRLLNATNQVREEFRNHFPFPLILWVNDDILQKLIRLVPDFESWTTISEFSILTKDLVDFIQQESDRVFHNFLAPLKQQFLLGHALMDAARQREFCWTLAELKSRSIQLPGALEARVQFILGRQAYERDELERAEQFYLQSFKFWNRELPRDSDELFGDFSQAIAEQERLENQGILLLHLGLCYFRKAELRAVQRQANWEQARARLQSCVAVFEAANREDLVARLITYLGEVLRYLENWQTLEQVVKRSLRLHETYGRPIQLAVDYGFLAEIALHHQQWTRANQFAAKALKILGESAGDRNQQHYTPYYPVLTQLYRLILVKAQAQLEETQKATETLETAVRDLPMAIESTAPLYDPWRYLRILEGVRRLYFEKGCYLEAFNIKLKQRSIEAAYGFRAFIGAGRLEAYREAMAIAQTTSSLEENIAKEIQAAGRQSDVDQLRERTLRPDCKLTILYGPSGVGKSSILHAGLIPALKRMAPSSREIVPISIRVYSDWCRELGKRLAKALGFAINGTDNNTTERVTPAWLTAEGDCSSTAILQQFRQNAEQNRLTVLIFEQFEEFFFNNPQLTQRKSFYAFFQEALTLPYFSIIISIREDYIDNLLEVERFIDSDRESRDLLSKKNRYYLGNLSQDSGRKIIQVLTSRAHFDLEPQLLDRLVEDLADEQQEIRPIELQIVGTQLQAKNIQTLAEYERSGNFKNLVEGFIEEAVRDCGRENETLAQLVLFFLTGENNSRPLKTRSELAKELGRNPENLNLVLKILKQSGLVVAHPEVPHHRYQLIHDYLVPLIRQKQELAKEAETQALRQENRLLRELAQAQTLQKQSHTRFVRSLFVVLAGTVLSVIGFASLWLFATGETRKAERAQQEAAIAEIDAHNSASQALLLSTHQFEALVESVKAGRQFQQLQRPEALPALRGQILSQVQQAFYGITERNRLEGHSNSVLDVAIAPNGRWIASASQDRTVKLWKPDGTLVQTLLTDEGGATSVSFSPDTRFLVTASDDRQGRGTVTLWQLDGAKTREVRHWVAHPNTVTHVAFSPDGQTLVTASWDGTAQLWTLDGRALATLKGHGNRVLDASFSPDGQTIATASLDKTARVWDLEGKAIEILQGHTDGVTGVAYSPDGQLLATASADRTVKLWTPNGQPTVTLQRPNGDIVWDVTFSADSQTLATASNDKIVTLWTRQGKPIQTLRGHRKPIRSVSFSPDGETIATASEDNTVELWSPGRPKQPALRGQQGEIWAVAFSPNGQLVVTGSRSQDDESGDVKLWRPDGTALYTLERQGRPANWVGFSPDGRIASASDDGTLKLWNSDGTRLMTFNHGEKVSAASFSPDGKTIATVGDRALKLWNSDGTRRLTVLAQKADRFNSVAFSPDGQRLITGQGDGQGSDYTVKLWNLQGKVLRTFTGHQGSVNWVSFSPDGQTIASASRDKTLKLWNLKGNAIQTLTGHIGQIYWVSFSPDGQTIASASEDGTVKLWRVADGTLLTTFEGHKAAVLSVSFSPDGKQLASASKDTTVLFWNLNLENLLDLSCDWVADYLQTNRNVKESDRSLCD